jgi:hypothetical protein
LALISPWWVSISSQWESILAFISSWLVFISSMMATKHPKSTMIIRQSCGFQANDSINPTKLLKQSNLINPIYPTSDTSCHVLVTRQRVWIGN